MADFVCKSCGEEISMGNIPHTRNRLWDGYPFCFPCRSDYRRRNEIDACVDCGKETDYTTSRGKKWKCECGGDIMSTKRKQE